MRLGKKVKTRSHRMEFGVKTLNEEPEVEDWEPVVLEVREVEGKIGYEKRVGSWRGETELSQQEEKNGTIWERRVRKQTPGKTSKVPTPPLCSLLD